MAIPSEMNLIEYVTYTLWQHYGTLQYIDK